MRKPDFFIIGAPKCGTTALAHWLSEHPNVYMSPVKEPHFYNTDINNSDIRDRTAYESLFSGASETHLAVGEASVWYLYSRDAIPNILEDIEDPKFIVMLRNPVDMAISLHEQMIFSGMETEQDIHRAWKLQEKRACGKKIPVACPDGKLLLYRETCSLGRQMQRLCKWVPRGRLQIILLDDIKSDARSVWIQVMEFLGVPDDGRREFPVINAAKRRRWPLVKQINDFYALSRKKLSLPPLGTGILRALDRRNIVHRQRPPVDERVTEMLHGAFDPEIELLEEVTGRDLAHWKDTRTRQRGTSGGI